MLADAIALVQRGDKTISIENPTNFTVEIRRIATDIWPEYKKPITAYCFRHQFAASLKSHCDGSLVSLALGHRSLKTKMVYGQRGQRRGKPYDISVNTSHDISEPIAFPRSHCDQFYFFRECGRARLVIDAEMVHAEGKSIQASLPYGVLPRLILLDVFSSAVRYKTVTIP